MTVRRAGRRRAAVVLVCGAVALSGLTGCEEASAPAAAGRAPGSATPARAGVPPAPVRPGLLVNQDTPFSASDVERLRHVTGVTGLALIGYGLVQVYEQQIPTATIDPSTYRPFTPAQTQDSDAVWTAVGQGGALVSHEVGIRHHLPLEATVPAGWATVRIAGLATTVPGIDMIVSSRTGERIGVPYGNGLVMAVSGDPGRAVERIRRVIGSKPVIRRIAGASATSAASGLSAPAGPLLPVITPSATASAGPAAPTTPGTTSRTAPRTPPATTGVTRSTAGPGRPG
ncbi:hypothetical protein ACRYCC_27910 [Actinomadura scrupuli]|uniref:hypothetical protein n=1 Tax=Actinomadura scrupuli TaxID=559629 RepID=UPI003D98E05F